MNKKEECEIVKDLAQQFIEKSISEGSEGFVKKHLETCEECKKFYQSKMSQLNDQNDEIVIDQFKKVNRHMNILKISLISVLVIIVSICLICSGKVYFFKKIVNPAYEKIEEMKQLNNYKLTVKTINKNLRTGDSLEYEKTYYYKDGKYKIEDKDSIKFCQDDSYESIIAYHKQKQIEYHQQAFIDVTKGMPIRIFTEIINHKHLPIIFILGESIREERYNGMDCYVIRHGDYIETWINKENFMTVREINEDYTTFYREVVYTFEENTVTDDDVDSKILNSDKYNDYVRKDIKEEYTEELKLYYELYNKTIQ